MTDQFITRPHSQVWKMLFQPRPKTRIYFFLTILIALSVAGCTVKFVSDYDPATFEETIRVGKEIDRFYGDLIETGESDRQYQKFSGRYVEIEADIRSLITRNKARPLNDESTEISEIILRLWEKYKQKHQQTDTYPTQRAILERGRFARLFVAAASAEQAKKLDTTDKAVDMNKD